MSKAQPQSSFRIPRIIYYCGLFVLLSELFIRLFVTFNILTDEAVILSVELLIWVAYVIFFLAAFLKRDVKMYRSGLEWPLLLFLLYLFVSLGLDSTQHKLPAFIQTVQYANHILLFFVLYSMFVHYVNPRYVVFAVCAVAVIISMYGLFQHHYIYPALDEAIHRNEMISGYPPGELRDKLLERLSSGQILGTLPGPNELGGLLAMVGPLLLMLIISAWQNKRKWTLVVNGLAFFILCYCMLLTDSKGGIVALLAGLTVVGLAYKLKSCAMLAKVAVATMVLAIAASLFISFQDSKSDYFSRNAKKIEAKSTLQKVERSMLIRFQYWQVAGRIIEGDPLFGVGLRNYADHLPQHKIAEGEETKLVHSNYLELMVSLGLIGMCLFAWLVYRYLKGLTDLPADDSGYSAVKDFKIFIIGAGVAMIILAVQWLGAFSFEVTKLTRNTEMQKGFMVLAVIVWLVFMLVNVKNMKVNKSDPLFVCGLFGAIIAFAVHGLVDYGVNVSALMHVFMVLAAALLALRRQAVCLWAKHKTMPVYIWLGSTVLVLVCTAMGMKILPAFVDAEVYRDSIWQNIDRGGAGQMSVTSLIDDGDVVLARWDQRVPLAKLELLERELFVRASAGQAKAAAQSFQECLETYAAVMKINPLAGEFPFRLANLYFDKSNYTKTLEQRNQDLKHALDYYHQAIVLYPAKPIYHYKLAKAYELLEDTELAAKSFAEALNLSRRQFHDRLQLDGDQQQECGKKSQTK